MPKIGWQNNDIIDLLKYNQICFSITVALDIFLSLLATSCIAVRAFSNLRTIKTWRWLRSMTGDDRLNGLCLCLLRVHRK